MDATFLQTVWFLLVGVLLAGYAILDGFDLGVGMLHPLARGDRERRIVFGAIGPIWDGNEVWLVTFGGALFAAFPEAYATIFSAFYELLMLVLLALILRAVSIEFRSKIHSARWRRAWDWAFFGSSLGASALYGIAVGNALLGIPLDERYVFRGTFADLLGPYPILIGLLTVAMFAMHGALFLCLKTPEGPLHDRVREWMWHTWGVFLVLYVLATIYTLVDVGQAVPSFRQRPWAVAVVVINVLAIANVPRSLYHGRPGQAFVSSAVTIASLVTLLGLALWPNLVTASNEPGLSLTVSRAASSPKTLTIMLIIALIGMPLVLSYTVAVYWAFRGKVRLEEDGY